MHETVAIVCNARRGQDAQGLCRRVARATIITP
jgi:hypothetical protein